MFDPFGSLGGGDGSNILGGWSSFSSTPAPNIQTQNNNIEQKSSDPFAGFGKNFNEDILNYVSLNFDNFYPKHVKFIAKKVFNINNYSL